MKWSSHRADGVGQAAFQPHMIVALLLYANCLGVRSSRQIERLCERDVAFRVVAGNLRPPHAIRTTSPPTCHSETDPAAGTSEEFEE